MSWRNHFLDGLGARDAAALRPAITLVNLNRNDVLAEPGRAVGHAYFPVDAILSVVTVMRSGAQVESRTIGRESGYGLLYALGSTTAFDRMIVQVGGGAWRVPLPPLREAIRGSPELVHLIVRHAQASIVQASQNSACNSLHPAEQRLCRWLLLTQDRLGADVLPLTQEHLSIMLGVQRTTVTAIASQLQERGAIAYARGKITVLDRARVQRCACECYEAIREGIETLIGDADARRRA